MTLSCMYLDHLLCLTIFFYYSLLFTFDIIECTYRSETTLLRTLCSRKTMFKILRYIKKIPKLNIFFSFRVFFTSHYFHFNIHKKNIYKNKETLTSSLSPSFLFLLQTQISTLYNNQFSSILTLSSTTKISNQSFLTLFNH